LLNSFVVSYHEILIKLILLLLRRLQCFWLLLVKGWNQLSYWFKIFN